MIKDIKQAFDEVQKEMSQKELEIYKEYFRKTLEVMEKKKNEKEKIEEELRILKLDLEDLKEGKLDKIRERQEKSNVAKNISAVLIKTTPEPAFPNGWYYGTYTVTTANYNLPITNGNSKIYYY